MLIYFESNGKLQKVEYEVEWGISYNYLFVLSVQENNFKLILLM